MLQRGRRCRIVRAADVGVNDGVGRLLLPVLVVIAVGLGPYLRMLADRLEGRLLMKTDGCLPLHGVDTPFSTATGVISAIKQLRETAPQAVMSSKCAICRLVR